MWRTTPNPNHNTNLTTILPQFGGKIGGKLGLFNPNFHKLTPTTQHQPNFWAKMTRNWGYPQLGPNFLHIPGPNSMKYPRNRELQALMNRPTIFNHRKVWPPFIQSITLLTLLYWLVLQSSLGTNQYAILKRVLQPTVKSYYDTSFMMAPTAITNAKVKIPVWFTLFLMNYVKYKSNFLDVKIPVGKLPDSSVV